MTVPALASRTSAHKSNLALASVGHAWPPLLLTVLVLLTLGQFLQVGLVSTDWWPVVSTNRVQNLAEFVRAFQEPIGGGDAHFIHETARHYRPLATLSFALDYKLWGLDGAGWQLTNLLVHLGVTLGVYALVRTLGLARWAAMLAAAVFTLHPAIVGTEPGIARRHDTLSALFLMGSLVLLLRGRRILPGILFFLSILSKETSLAVLPFVPFLLRAVDRPMTRTWVLLPPAVIALGMRILAIGDLGGYGTATVPSVDALPIYWDKIGKYFTDLFFPLPVRPGTVAALVLVAAFVGVAGAALTLPRKERYLTFVGLLWVYGFALFYAGLKVYAGSWYLYIPLMGVGLCVAGLASGGLARRAERRAGWLSLALSTVMAAGVLVSSPLVMPYPDWSESHVVVEDYLRHVDTCTENGHPPLYPANENRRMVFVSPAGLLDYSVTAYIALRFPNGRPCEPTTTGALARG
ncbi:MAG: hypothetical protein LC797_06005 [Chloroflexi bacterium]|nr:hypothetical protein [Chloroflexota bacterium]